MKTWEDTKKELLKDRRFAREWRQSEPQRAVAVYLVSLRTYNGWTQQELADRLGMKQSEISLIEDGERNLSLRSLQKIARATGAQLEINFKF